MSIRIFYDNTDYRLKGSGKAIKFIDEVIRIEKRIPGDLSFIMTDDESLRKINVSFLEHDYNTDVITFNYNSGNRLNGEVYISIDTVRQNSINYNVSLEQEVVRVMFHGILHLVGYDDKTDNQRKEIRIMEDKWLNMFYG